MTRFVSSLLIGLLLVTPSNAAAQTDELDDRIAVDRVEFQPAPGVVVWIGDREHAGSLDITSHGGGLSLVEETTVDSYLLGIREVPFSWPAEALAAQVVAARTYLGWTLERGRSPNGRAFDYDICATTACQVYSGVGGLTGPDGRRWADAVRRTSGEVLTTGGSPIQALYSSTSDGRTRNVEDVFPGAAPDPNLRGVESPGETSPFVDWEFSLTHSQASALFGHAGILEGTLLDVTSRRTADGEGPWTVTITATEGRRTVDTWTLRTLLNRAAAELFPGSFPVLRPDSDRRYPQTIMSPNYTIESGRVLTRPELGPPGLETMHHVRGGGWGHLVGMSQYGAEAMARAGESYPDILAHFYGGARPTVGDVLPESIRVGLGTEHRELEFRPDGPLRVVVDGEEVSPGELGSWIVTWEDGTAVVDPPEGLGLPPRVEGWRTFFDSSGDIELVTVRSRTAAEVRIITREGAVVIADTGWEVRDAGPIAVDVGRIRPGSVLVIEVRVRSPLGEDTTSLRIPAGAE